MNSFSYIKLKKKLLYFFLFLFIFLFIFAATGLSLEKKFINHLGMEFILVQPGSFVMGSPRDEPYRDKNEVQHKVNIVKAYYLQTTEVTLKQWKAVMGRKLFGRKKGQDNTPVTKVSFHDSEDFIEKLNKLNKIDKGRYRLPSEAEWEYACRAGTKTAYSWGETIDCSKAMYQNNKKKASDCVIFYKSMRLHSDMPAPVKSFPPNPWGFYDMHGNVWEWCSDKYREYLSTGTDTLKDLTRIRRGGSWYKYEVSLRSANRAFAHPSSKFQTTGFRLVFEAD
ncbi:MAG: formylglycine-generating enzyme family protein [Thermodesulfobacteriota bacterium]